MTPSQLTLPFPLKSERLSKRATHGGSANGRITREYQAWRNMRSRCTNQNRQDWHHYGGRGITFCERWNDYANFLADMGPCPEGLTLDRIDVDKNYEPTNCRWTTWTVQRHNRKEVTHCKRGHPFTEENTLVEAAGRHCKTCKKEAEQRRYNARKSTP